MLLLVEQYLTIRGLEHRKKEVNEPQKNPKSFFCIRQKSLWFENKTAFTLAEKGSIVVSKPWNVIISSIKS